MSMSRGHLRIKRIYDPLEKTDGKRVLVDRVWPRGIKKERAALSLWLKDIAPTTPLRKWFNHDPARWQEFKRRYRAELDGNKALVKELLDLAAEHDVTLLFAAHDTSHNNAAALLDYLLQTQSPPRRTQKAKP